MEHLADLPSHPVSAQPGWYPDPVLPGAVRWWDGSAWSAHLATCDRSDRFDERSMAVMAHVLGIVTGFVGPLVVYLVARPDQRFAKQHAAAALNFELTALLAMTVACLMWVAGMLLSFVSGVFAVAMLAMPALLVTMVLLPALAAGAAHRGELHRYRVVIPFVRA